MSTGTRRARDGARAFYTELGHTKESYTEDNYLKHLLALGKVTEEVVVRRKGSDHIETVHDTVRRQQVEVERVPAKTTKE